MRQHRYRQVDNLIPLLEKLSDKEQAFLCRMINLYGSRLANVHRGSLPFMNRMYAAQCLQNCIDAVSASSDPEIRYAKKVLTKLNVAEASKATVTFEMYLDDNKVRKYSNGMSDSRLNIRLPFTTTKEVGLQWQEFGKKWMHPLTDVHYILELQKLRPGLWKITGPKKLEDRIKEWLFERFHVAEV